MTRAEQRNASKTNYASDQVNAPQANDSSGSCWRWIIVALYGVVVLAIVPVHEPWRDEAHTWLIARDLSCGGIVQQMHYEGYPPLWFWLQAPLAKQGLPFASLGILNALCATLAVAVMVYFSPFALWQKALIAFSYGLFCCYGMVWRCYSLLILALFLVAAVYPARHRRPLLYALCVVLLANVHVLSLGVALLFLLGFIVGVVRRHSVWSREVARADTKTAGPASAQLQPKELAQSGAANASATIFLPTNLLACLIMAAGVTLLVLQLRQPPDCRSPGLFPFFKPMVPLGFLAMAFDPVGRLPAVPFYFCSLAAFVLLLWDLRKARDVFWLLLLTYLGWCYVFTFKSTNPAAWHNGLLLIMMIVACWIGRATSPPTSSLDVHMQNERFRWRCDLPLREAIVFASLVYGMLNVPDWIYREIRYPFSAGQEAATVLRNVSLSEPIVAYPLAHGQSLLPYLPGRKFWGLEMGRFDTFDTACQQYDACKIQSLEELLKRIYVGFPNRRPWIVMGIDHSVSGIERAGYDLVYPSSEVTVWGWGPDMFWVYRPKDAPNPK